MPILSKLLAAGATGLLLLVVFLPGREVRGDRPAAAVRTDAAPADLLRRQASPEEVARWVGELGDERYAVRQKATRALEEVGQPALKALAEALKSPQVEVQRRARQVMERIEVNEATAPTLVRLQLKGVPVTRAVDELNRQGRIKLELVPQQGPVRQQLEQRKIDLDLDRVPFWEALEKLCQSAGLVYLPRGARTIQLEPTDVPARRVPTAYSGPFRLRVTTLNYGRSLNLLGHGHAGTPQQAAAPALTRHEHLSLSLDAVAEPHITVISIGPLQLHEAVDDAGESLLSEGAATPSTVQRHFYDGTPTMLQTLNLQLGLRPPNRPAATLKDLKGTLTVEVLTQRKPLIVVDNLLTTKNKLHRGEGDLSLLLLQVQDQGNGTNGSARFALAGLEKFAAEMGTLVFPGPGQPANVEQLRPAFELTDANGRPYALNLNLSYTGTQGSDGVLEGSFYYSAMPECGPPARLTFYSLKRVRTNLPFEFQNVPLP